MTRIAKVLSLVTFASVLGFAGLASAGNETVTVSYIGCSEAGECFIGITPALTTAATTCSERSQVRFMSNQLGADFIYKTALAAYFAGKKLVINASNTCLSNFPRPVYVHTLP